MSLTLGDDSQSLPELAKKNGLAGHLSGAVIGRIRTRAVNGWVRLVAGGIGLCVRYL
jgi:hypothetical protein